MLQLDGSWLIYYAIQKETCSVDHILMNYYNIINPESPFLLIVDGMLLLSKSTEHGRKFIMQFTKAEGFTALMRVVEKGVILEEVRFKTFEEMVQQANQMFKNLTEIPRTNQNQIKEVTFIPNYN